MVETATNHGGSVTTNEARLISPNTTPNTRLTKLITWLRLEETLLVGRVIFLYSTYNSIYTYNIVVKISVNLRANRHQAFIN